MEIISHLKMKLFYNTIDIKKQHATLNKKLKKI